jgi:hypothetical protein
MILSSGFAQQPSNPTVEQLADNIYRINIGTANTGLIVGEKSDLLIC